MKTAPPDTIANRLVSCFPQIILALGMSLAVGVVVMAVIWSGSPPSPRETATPPYQASWRPTNHFRAVARAIPPVEAAITVTGGAYASARTRQPPNA